MKTLFTCLVVVLIVVFAFSQAPVVPGLPTDDVYVVQKGDVLYTLEGNYSGRPWQWGRLVELNPFLQSKGRTWIDEKGRTIVLIRPGEKLLGLNELGIASLRFPVKQPTVDPVPNPVPVSIPAPSHDYSWLWWLLLIPIAFLLWFLIRMRRDPVTAGPAIVSGGVTDQTVAGQFRENISQTTGTPIDRVEIRGLVRGYIHGVVIVRYRDGSQQRMLLGGRTGYRAMVRRNGGPWQEEYMLQVCGNDIRMSGARYIPGMGFRFVPEAAVEETSRPAPTPTVPTPTQPEPAPRPAPAEGERHFTFRPAAGGRPNMVDFEGFASFEVEVKDGRTTVRFS